MQKRHELPSASIFFNIFPFLVYLLWYLYLFLTFCVVIFMFSLKLVAVFAVWILIKFVTQLFLCCRLQGKNYFRKSKWRSYPRQVRANSFKINSDSIFNCVHCSCFFPLRYSGKTNFEKPIYFSHPTLWLSSLKFANKTFSFVFCWFKSGWKSEV